MQPCWSTSRLRTDVAILEGTADLTPLSPELTFRENVLLEDPAIAMDPALAAQLQHEQEKELYAHMQNQDEAASTDGPSYQAAHAHERPRLRLQPKRAHSWLRMDPTLPRFLKRSRTACGQRHVARPLRPRDRLWRKTKRLSIPTRTRTTMVQSSGVAMAEILTLSPLAVKVVSLECTKRRSCFLKIRGHCEYTAERIVACCCCFFHTGLIVLIPSVCCEELLCTKRVSVGVWV